MAHDFGIQLSLIAFATAAVQGLVSGVDLQQSLQSALLCLLVFYILGWILGELARRLIEENVTAEIAAAANQRTEPGPETAIR